MRKPIRIASKVIIGRMVACVKTRGEGYDEVIKDMGCIPKHQSKNPIC